jgi:DNA-binding MarR family transcriptional regulator
MKGSPENPAVPRLIGLVRAMRDCCQRQEGEICHKLALTASQFACLVALPETGDLTVQQVAAGMRLSASRASRVVESLVREGVLERQSTGQDRRQQHLTLSTMGRAKWQRAHMLLVECEQKLLAHLSTQESRELEEALQTVINALTGERVKQAKKELSITA